MKNQSSNQPAGCTIKIWLTLGLWIILIAGWYIYFNQVKLESIFTFSLICGTLSLLTVWSFRALFSRYNEIALNRALQGLPMIDGQWSAAVGEIHPRTKQLLTAPFSGQAAIAYKYWVTCFDRIVPGTNPRISKNQHLITAYTGFAIAPCEIRTNRGPVSVQGMPTINGESKQISDDEAYQRARTYVANTVFEDAFSNQSTKAQGLPDAENFSATPPGILRVDRRENPGLDLEGWTLDETIVRPGEQVCVYGVYSEARKCLIAPPEGTSGRMFTLIPGDIQKIQETARSQRTFMIILGFILLLIQVFVTWMTWK
jgi:hypothetical protein